MRKDKGKEVVVPKSGSSNSNSDEPIRKKLQRMPNILLHWLQSRVVISDTPRIRSARKNHSPTPPPTATATEIPM